LGGISGLAALARDFFLAGFFFAATFLPAGLPATRLRAAVFFAFFVLVLAFFRVAMHVVLQLEKRR
jgi:hypothetical protein